MYENSQFNKSMIKFTCIKLECSKGFWYTTFSRPKDQNKQLKVFQHDRQDESELFYYELDWAERWGMWRVYVFVRVCVCVRERERERERDGHVFFHAKPSRKSESVWPNAKLY